MAGNNANHRKSINESIYNLIGLAGSVNTKVVQLLFPVGNQQAKRYLKKIRETKKSKYVFLNDLALFKGYDDTEQMLNEASNRQNWLQLK